jgi:hypothetical protein
MKKNRTLAKNLALILKNTGLCAVAHFDRSIMYPSIITVWAKNTLFAHIGVKKKSDVGRNFSRILKKAGFWHWEGF